VTALSELEILSRTAAGFPPRTVRGIVLPNLLFFTDPARVADPGTVAERLPRGAGIVFRAFGAPDAVEQGQRLRAIADARGLILLVGADASLAKAIKADGLHMPQRLVPDITRLRIEHPTYLITAAAHDAEALQAAEQVGADAAVVSPVFASNSPSAGAPLGMEGLETLVRATSLPVYALGGVRADTAARLADTGIVGLAAVEALAGP
jgi:thiamine-phosphate pyrophosphorylase